MKFKNEINICNGPRYCNEREYDEKSENDFNESCDIKRNGRAFVRGGGRQVFAVGKFMRAFKRPSLSSQKAGGWQKPYDRRYGKTRVKSHRKNHEENGRRLHTNSTRRHVRALAYLLKLHQYSYICTHYVIHIYVLWYMYNRYVYI